MIALISPVSSIQLSSLGAGVHSAVAAHTDVLTEDGRYPLLHWYVTIAPSLVWE